MDNNADPGSAQVTRREVLGAAAASLVLISLQKTSVPSSHAEAQAAGKRVRQLSSDELVVLRTFAEVLLPGAAEVGVSNYVNDQLDQKTPLLFLRYMDYPGSFIDFYRQGLRALQGECKKRFGIPFEQCSLEKQTALITELSQSTPGEWTGPPAPLFYLVVRNDAVDVFYGTPEGAKRLDLPYSALLKPPPIAS